MTALRAGSASSMKNGAAPPPPPPWLNLAGCEGKKGGFTSNPSSTPPGSADIIADYSIRGPKTLFELLRPPYCLFVFGGSLLSAGYHPCPAGDTGEAR